MFQIQDINDGEFIFGGNIQKLMPKYNEIPEEFKNGYTKWNSLFNDWFFRGLKSLNITPKDGVNKDRALKHIATIMRSFEPQHEHKEAACAYLFDQWFSDVQYEAK